MRKVNDGENVAIWEFFLARCIGYRSESVLSEYGEAAERRPYCRVIWSFRILSFASLLFRRSRAGGLTWDGMDGEFGSSAGSLRWVSRCSSAWSCSEAHFAGVICNL